MRMHHDNAYFDKTPIEKQRVCCNCRHNRRTGEGNFCDIDGHYIGYVGCFEEWCKHWASDAEKYAWSVITQRAADTIAALSAKVADQNLTHGKRTETHGVCSDLIKRQYVYDALEQYDREHVEPQGYDDYYNGFLNVIQTIPAEPQWIPCSEKLPEKDGRYLVCMSWSYHNMDVYMWADGWNCVRCINGGVDRTNEIDGADIVAWMRLPEPWKDDEQEL